MTSIAFTSLADGTQHIYLMGTNAEHEGGPVVQRLTSSPYPDSYLQWRPDGAKIVFERATQYGPAIWTMNADGSNQVQLSTGIPSKDTKPCFSPDGAHIVYSYILAGSSSPPPTQLRTMSADGSGVTTILNNGFFNMEPRWSPDGTKILFMSSIDKGSTNGIQLYTLNTSTLVVTALTAVNNANHGDPAWSPDGTKIAFARLIGGKLNLYTMKSDGTSVVQLTYYSEPFEAGDPSWSPDGSLIAFELSNGANSQSLNTAPGAIWIVKSDGTGKPYATGQAAAGSGASPRWKPA